MIVSILKAVLVSPSVYTLSFFYSWTGLIVNLGRRAFQKIPYLKAKRRFVRPKCLDDPSFGRHEYVQLSNIKLHYVENGDSSKPLMVCVHGFPEFWFSWRYQLKEFSSSHRVVALDLRGYGDSDKPTNIQEYDIKQLENDLVEFIKALSKNNKKCILVGHDWGGVICWTVAAKFPELFEKLIIMNSPHPSTFAKKLVGSVIQLCKSWYIFFFGLPFLPERMMLSGDMMIYNYAFMDEKFNLSVTEEEIEAYKYTYSRTGAWTFPINYYRQNLDLKGIAQFEKNPLPKIKFPTLIIWGGNDFVFTNDIPELARPFVENLTVKYIPKGNHFVHHHKPTVVNAQIADFLKIN